MKKIMTMVALGHEGETLRSFFEAWAKKKGLDFRQNGDNAEWMVASKKFNRSNRRLRVQVVVVRSGMYWEVLGFPKFETLSERFGKGIVNSPLEPKAHKHKLMCLEVSEEAVGKAMRHWWLNSWMHIPPPGQTLAHADVVGSPPYWYL